MTQTLTSEGQAENEDATMYALRLYITGTSPVSVRAITNLRAILEENLKGRYELEIIDIYQQPLLAEKDNVAAVPMLIKSHPQPTRRLIGDMSDIGTVLKGLGLK